MPNLKKAGRLFTVAALATSTTLAGPSFAFAQERATMRLAQASPDEIAPDAPAEETAPVEEPAPEPEAVPEPQPEPEAAPEPVQEAEPAPEPEPAPVEEPAPAEPAMEAPAEAAPAEEPAPVEEAPAAEAPADQAPAGETPPVDQPADAAPADAAPAEAAPAEEAPAAEAPAETAPDAPADVPAPADAPIDVPAPTDAPAEAPVDEAPAARKAEPEALAPAETAPAPSPEAAPVEAAPPAAEAPPVPEPANPDAPAEAPSSAAPDQPVPAPDGVVPAPVEPAPAEPGAAAAPPAADMAAPPAAEAVAPPASPVAETPQAVPADIQTAPVEQGAIDQSDARVQTLSQPVVVQSVTVERGERTTEAPRYELPPRAKVVERVGDRDIISIVGAAAAGAAVGVAAGYFIRSNDDERLAVDSREVYSERLPRGRNRETIVRPNGSQVVTITNEYGDVIQRSRITPDGEEIVLFYDPYSGDEQRPDYYDDPGEDLPPLELTIPRDGYIVDVAEPDEELYFDTIVAPPVETVERIYSVDEVRRSSRIRDKVRRIDLNTITFDFGSAAISQDEVKNLQALADAVSRVIKDNPGETFLIEGHTDAVGSNVANLALSDQRAEAVATALSQYFDIPSENLITQGYGEEDLKVNTQSENRENRRVTLRRITALVKPVNTAAAR